MNKRQKLVFKLSKCMFKAIKKNSNDTRNFEQTYRSIRWSYSSEPDSEIRETLKWVRKQY